MNHNYIRKTACILLLLLTFCLNGCEGRKPSADNDNLPPTSAAEVTGNADEAGNTQSDLAEPLTEGKDWPSGSVTFSSSYGYSEFLKLYLELPEGVSASDLTELAFTVDTEAPLELRLYAGADDIQKSSAHELTGETVKAEAVSEGSEQVEVDGTFVEQENFSLNLNKKDVTRFYLSEGKGQSIVFDVDDRAAEVLSSIDKNIVVIGLYANNMAPEFTIYGVSYIAQETEYPVTLDENTVKPTQRSYLQFH